MDSEQGTGDQAMQDHTSNVGRECQAKECACVLQVEDDASLVSFGSLRHCGLMPGNSFDRAA